MPCVCTNGLHMHECGICTYIACVHKKNQTPLGSCYSSTHSLPLFATPSVCCMQLKCLRMRAAIADQMAVASRRFEGRGGVRFDASADADVAWITEQLGKVKLIDIVSGVRECICALSGGDERGSE